MYLLLGRDEVGLGVGEGGGQGGEDGGVVGEQDRGGAAVLGDVGRRQRDEHAKSGHRKVRATA